jgi:hypothetical protein
MTYIPVPQRTNNQKVSGTFYPLQKEELMALRKSRLINNAAYVHLALRFENPFCDRPIELAPKEFARRWTIPESSVYEALGRLKKLEIVNIKTGKIVISWAEDEGRGQEAVLRRDSFSVECAGRGNSFPAQEAQCFHSVDVDSSQPSPVDCQQAVISDNPDLLRDLRNDWVWSKVVGG